MKSHVVAGQRRQAGRFLPMGRDEMAALGWSELDVLLVTGDAYVDHPSFGVPLLGRWLQSHGFRVGIVAQPRWDTADDLLAMGRPRLFAGVTAGAMDSMLAHYTAFRKKRSDDAYTPGGMAGKRPNRACIVYTNLVRRAFPGLPVVIGGIEASLRRASHYDFWTDKIRRSILLDSKADLLAYGMGERAILEIAQRLHNASLERRESPDVLRGIGGTAFALPSLDALESLPNAPKLDEVMILPSHEGIVADAGQLIKSTLDMERQVHQGLLWAAQDHGGRQVVFAPPSPLLETAEMDAIYALPFTRSPHPSYKEPIPAAGMIQFSVTSHRGCAGGCSFCSITSHQGRQVSSRSAESLINEVRAMTQHPDWKGSISDVGGPTANMWGAYCADDHTTCRRGDCLTPKVCRHFKTSDAKMATMLKTLRDMEGVKHLRVASGVRYDLIHDDSPYLSALVGEFVGGQLKIAPEHMSEHVLRLMRKPAFAAFEAFIERFGQECARAGKEQYVIPYLVSAFPGCTDDDMRDLGRWLRDRGWKPRQVQCFIPTPGSVATAMYHAGTDHLGRPISVAKTDQERLRQHGILLNSE